MNKIKTYMYEICSRYGHICTKYEMKIYVRNMYEIRTYMYEI